MIAVIDANIALSLMLNLAHSAKARRVVASTTSMIAPDLLMHETANALWRIAKNEPSITPTCQQILKRIPALFDDICPSISLADDALALAIRINHSAHDCFYLELARVQAAALITADKRLANAAALAYPAQKTILIEA